MTLKLDVQAELRGFLQRLARLPPCAHPLQNMLSWQG